MKIAVAGKGGVGKTVVSGTLARTLARSGHPVLALDCDVNPMLGITLGLGPEGTERLVAARQALDDGEIEHQPTIEGIVETFGAEAPDGVQVVVVSRIDRADPPWPWCGLAPEQLLGELEVDGRIVISDLEAGLGTLLRLRPGHADVVLVIANATAKSLEVARRGVTVAAGRDARVVVVANRVRGEDDVAMVREVAGEHELAIVPEDPVISRADRDGRAPIDLACDAPGISALSELARRLVGGP